MGIRSPHFGSKRNRRLTNSPILTRAFKPVLESLESRRMLTAGQLDPTFNTNGTPGYVLEQWGFQEATGVATAVQANGKIIVAADLRGETADYTGVARLNADGTLDETFGTGGTFTIGGAFGTTTEARNIVIDPGASADTADDTIWLVGSTSGEGHDGEDFFASQITDSGTHSEVYENLTDVHYRA